MIKDYFVIPLKSIQRQKVRSWLTLLGIIMGIAAVISLITLGQGLENAIEEQFEGLGKDKLFITAKGNPLTAGISIEAVEITQKDKDVVESVSGVKQTAGFLFTTSRIEYNDNVRYFYIFGNPTDPQQRKLIGESQNYKILYGRSFEKGEKNKAVLGIEFLNPDTFGKAVELGDDILIQNQEFKVIGFWDRIGSPPDDQSVSIPIKSYQELFDVGDNLGLIIAQTDSGENVDTVAAAITKDLRKSRSQSVGEEDFSIETPAQLASAFSTILDIVQAVLIGIAGISLFVGGVGIMNTMYTSVLEKTKEIGVMKALGARNRQILALFLVESGLYGLGGGIIGVTLGIGFAKGVEFIFSQFVGDAFLSIQISIPLLIGTLAFSFLVGCLSGIAPANRASKMNPVDALRYE